MKSLNKWEGHISGTLKKLSPSLRYLDVNHLGHVLAMIYTGVDEQLQEKISELS